jgi:hypothetical protein
VLAATESDERDLRSAARDVERARTSPVGLGMSSVMRLQRLAGNQATASLLTVHRKPQAPAAPDKYVGALFSGFDVGGKHEGEAGYSSRAMVKAGDAAAELRKSGDLDNLMLTPVSPDVSAVAAQEKAVADAGTYWEQEMPSGPPSIRQIFVDMKGRTQDWLNDVTGQKKELFQHGIAFNAFSSRANAYFMSATRLSRLQSLLGAPDNASFAAALQSGVADATKVASRYKDVLAGSDAKGPETLDVPQPDNSVAQAAGQLSGAMADLNNAYLRFQVIGSKQEAAAIHEEGAADRERLTQINEVKKFVREVGGAVDEGMSLVAEIPEKVVNVTQSMRKAEAQFNGLRNRKAIMNGEKPRFNPVYTTWDEGKELIVNTQTGKAKSARDPKAEESEAPSGGFPHLSAESILGGAVDFLYAAEVKEINRKLEAIHMREAAVQAWAEHAEFTAAANEFRNKMNEFFRKCAELQERVAARRNQYLTFGLQLDKFARSDKELQHQGLGTAHNHERYTTIMTAVSAVREMMALGREASSDVPTARDEWEWRQRAKERRGMSAGYSRYYSPGMSGKSWKLPSFNLTPGELDASMSMSEQMASFQKVRKALTEMFGPVDAAGRSMMSDPGVSPGGGSGNY